MEEEFELIGESAEGKIVSIGAPEAVTTKFGNRRRIPVTVELAGNQNIDISLWIPENFFNVSNIKKHSLKNS